jgi:hypothetical protein
MTSFVFQKLFFTRIRKNLFGRLEMMALEAFPEKRRRCGSLQGGNVSDIQGVFITK